MHFDVTKRGALGFVTPERTEDSFFFEDPSQKNRHDWVQKSSCVSAILYAAAIAAAIFSSRPCAGAIGRFPVPNRLAG